jgi:hypothetical protein
MLGYLRGFGLSAFLLLFFQLIRCSSHTLAWILHSFFSTTSIPIMPLFESWGANVSPTLVIIDTTNWNQSLSHVCSLATAPSIRATNVSTHQLAVSTSLIMLCLTKMSSPLLNPHVLMMIVHLRGSFDLFQLGKSPHPMKLLKANLLYLDLQGLTFHCPLLLPLCKF